MRGGGGLPNLLQYYNRGGGVYRDLKFVLRNKWTTPNVTWTPGGPICNQGKDKSQMW